MGYPLRSEHRAGSLRYEHSQFSAMAVDMGGFHCFEHEAWCARTDVLDWCEDQFGPEGTRWAYSRDGSTIYLQHAVDACAFRLRWC